MKESCIKLTGAGLAIPLKSIPVDPEDITQITQCIGDVLAGKCRADEAQISQHLRYYDWKRLSAHFEKLLMQ